MDGWIDGLVVDEMGRYMNKCIYDEFMMAGWIRFWRMNELID